MWLFRSRSVPSPRAVEMMDEAEVDVYLVMMEMLRPDSKLDMAGMWKERIPKLKLRIYQLDRYCTVYRTCKQASVYVKKVCHMRASKRSHARSVCNPLCRRQTFVSLL